MRILDLFSGAGGAAEGYHRAFPDAEIVGVDIVPQPRYPFEFVQADALEFLDTVRQWGDPYWHFDLIHASPPCQDHSTLRTMHEGHGTAWMLAATIERLKMQTAPWVVENVPGSERSMGGYFFTLCGSSFGLKVRRHRHFASSFAVLRLPCRHRQQGTPWGVYGHDGGGQMTRGYKATLSEACIAMGIDWMNRAEISQAIPPAYTQFIGEQLAAHLKQAAS